VTDPDADLSAATASVVVGGSAPVVVALVPGPSSDPDVPVGARSGALDLPAASEGTAVVTFAASDVAGHTAAPVMLSVPIAPKNAPFAGTPLVGPNPIPAGARTTLSCGTPSTTGQRVVVEGTAARASESSRSSATAAVKGDAVAGDGIYGSRSAK
jgi:hypothetical protein